MQSPFFVVAIFIVAALITGCESNQTASVSVSTLAVTPTAVTLEARTVSITEFTASGGTTNYTWSLSDSSLGSLYTAGATYPIVQYQNTTHIGTNILTLTDSDNNSVYATIWQK